MQPTSIRSFPSPEEFRFLQDAAAYLERPSFLIRVANLAGKPAEALLAALPQKAQTMIAGATSTALIRALDGAVRTLPQPSASARADKSTAKENENWLTSHLRTAAAATTGAVGGFFGLAGLPLEIPATTTVMLRSIAHIAAQSG